MPSQPESYLMYWDAYKLYGYAMRRKVPTSGGEIIQNITAEELLAHDCESDSNYICVVDLDYSDDATREKTKWYPLVPETIRV